MATRSRPRTRTRRKPTRCDHKTSTFTWRDSVPIARHCAVPQRKTGAFGCGAVLSLGPANDAGTEVQIEIRAAVLESAERARAWSKVKATSAEMAGWNDHGGGEAPMIPGRVPGWLARQLFPANGTDDPFGGADWPEDLTSRVAATHPEFPRLAGLVQPGAAARPAVVIAAIPPTAICGDDGCEATVETAYAAARGWIMIDGGWRCPLHLPAAQDELVDAAPAVLDHIDQGESEPAADAELVDLQDEPDLGSPGVKSGDKS
jgi:hypothetical protein